MQDAWALLRRNEPERAIDLLEGAVEVEPANPVPLIMLGLAQSDAARHIDAINTLRRAGTMAPANLLASTCLWLALLRSGQASAAAQQLLEIGIADNLAVRARLLAALENALREAGGPAPLREELLPPPADEPPSPAVDPAMPARRCFRNAVKAFHKGRYKAASELLKAAVGRGFETDEARLYLAGCDIVLGNCEQAAQALSAMPAKSTLRGPALFYAALARYLANDPEAARRLFDEAEATGSVHDFEEFIGYYRGLCHLAEGNEQAACRAFETALDIDWSLLPKRLTVVAGRPAAARAQA